MADNAGVQDAIAGCHAISIIRLSSVRYHSPHQPSHSGIDGELPLAGVHADVVSGSKWSSSPFPSLGQSQALNPFTFSIARDQQAIELHAPMQLPPSPVRQHHWVPRQGECPCTPLSLFCPTTLTHQVPRIPTMFKMSKSSPHNSLARSPSPQRPSTSLPPRHGQPRHVEKHETRTQMQRAAEVQSGRNCKDCRGRCRWKPKHGACDVGCRDGEEIRRSTAMLGRRTGISRGA